MFVDRAEIIITSGKGGDGAVTFRREPYVPEGGPDGGDGGDGGNIIFVADSNLRTLMDFKYKRKYEAENGQNGMRRKKYGKRGRDLEIKVPIGTMIIDKESGLLMKDMADKGDRLVAAKGGKGGKGNVHFKNSIRQAPNFAEAGELPKERTVILELKLIADVGLVGFPNVGKSTLLSVSTSARPKVANYHFTTIDPNLGVVDMYDKSFVMADIAGIIEGAHEGMGLGLKFLKHIERTKVLIHVVDISGSEGRDPIDDYKKIIEELGQYDEKLLSKPMLVAANKIDAACDEERLENFVKFVEADGKRVFKISAVARQGVQELLNAALNELENYIEPESDEIEYFDFVRDEIDEDFKKLKAYRDLDGVYVLEGKQLSKIFRSTNFNDIGSMRYLYKFIVDRGGIKMLEKLGLKEGDTVRIEDYEFEYYED
ncbi:MULTISPECIES: GTPase ObgE [Mogibacterium]|jgi:Obg family GTPase CgtA|uniref:GTPase Obg n=2 Tax=Mogibacterium timidum TaxID=35519 RepID=X8IRP8_9FIRM|nr:MULTISPECIES: GTPase ObgE [Mogibacterium]EJU19381.1 Obg family GTPase CgtA [Mogibacterium sp. CM50]EUC51696.1 Obg family GTPase CgtA [Mogibacterium timidum ATCC 33093]NWO23979.1 GTPase ObgE [Mogibacterium timidum]